MIPTARGAKVTSWLGSLVDELNERVSGLAAPTSRKFFRGRDGYTALLPVVISMGGDSSAGDDHLKVLVMRCWIARR